MGRQEDGSKMARGGQNGTVGGLEGDTSLLLPRKAKVCGREDGAFKPPCAGLETGETGNAVNSGKAPLS